MIGGLLTDVLVVAAVLAFAWGAAQLGGLATLGRLVEAAVAFVVAALLRDPAGSVVDLFIGRSDDFNRLVGMIVVGLATWIGMHRIYRWWRARRRAALVGDEPAFEDEDPEDPLDSALVARLAGGVLGIGWALLFLSLLVLQPASTPISRAAIDSRIGGAIIEQEDGLRWLRDGFPHYTQTLPKGELGAVAGELDDLPLREPVSAKERGAEADALLREVNGVRRGARIRVLGFNPDIAAVARRQALALARDQRLSTRAQSGSPLDARVLAALGEAAGSFGDEVGIEVVWAHNAPTAINGLLDRRESQAQLRDERWTEVGIGVADMGWFNGRIYVLLFVGPDGSAAEDELEEAGAAGAAGAIGSDPDASDGAVDGSIEPGALEDDPTSVDPCVGPDVDGDGMPDPTDPSLADCGATAPTSP